jgi:hypothetical protein
LTPVDAAPIRRGPLRKGKAVEIKQTPVPVPVKVRFQDAQVQLFQS